jgi:hypothetical protein
MLHASPPQVDLYMKTDDWTDEGYRRPDFAPFRKTDALEHSRKTGVPPSNPSRSKSPAAQFISADP